MIPTDLSEAPTTAPSETIVIDISSNEDSDAAEWIAKEGANCGDGYTDLETDNINYGLFCRPCPDETAGLYGKCTECGTLEEPNFNRTACEYAQPPWLYVLQVIGGLLFLGTCAVAIWKKGCNK